MLQNFYTLAVDMNSTNISETEKGQLALTVLLTGLVIVFVMLIVLTGIIKFYSSVIQKIFHSRNNAKGSKKEEKPAVKAPVYVAAPVPVVQEGISDEVVAAISAAVYETYGVSAAAIRSIRRVKNNSRSAWGTAGLAESTRPF